MRRILIAGLLALMSTGALADYHLKANADGMHIRITTNSLEECTAIYDYLITLEGYIVSECLEV